MVRTAGVFAKLQFFFTVILWVLPHAVFRITGAIVRAWLRKLPVGPSIWNGFAGALMVNTSPRQLQDILPSTMETYNAWVASHGTGRAVDILTADRSTRLLWVGPRDAKKVVLFFHGGGYVMPLSKGHLDWMAHVRNEARAAGIPLSVCILEYDLIPANPYPRQMLQGIYALNHLVKSGYRPSEIIFGGDSAGGHLALSLMAHLHRCRPTDPTTETSINWHGTVRGCFLVSPLASLNFNTSSYRRFFSVDVLSQKVVDKWGLYLVSNSPWEEEISAGNGWGMALDVPETWWENLSAVDQILVTGGYEEVFSDHVQRLGAMLKRKSKGHVALYMANEAHDGPLMDFAAGRCPSETTRTITDFVIACFLE